MRFCAFLLHKLLKMTEFYRAHYLLTSLAVVKRTCFDHDRYAFPGSSTTFQFKTRKLRQIVKGIQNLSKRHEKNSNWHRTRNERKRKFQLKRLIVRFHATKLNVTCNSCICHYQVITCNMQR